MQDLALGRQVEQLSRNAELGVGDDDLVQGVIGRAADQDQAAPGGTVGVTWIPERAGQWQNDYTVDFKMAYNHYFGAKAKKS